MEEENNTSGQIKDARKASIVLIEVEELMYLNYNS